MSARSNTIHGLIVPLLISIFLFACSVPPAPITVPTVSLTDVSPTTVSQSSFVKVTGLGFTLNDQPFQFVGANSIYFGYYKEFDYSIEDAIHSAKENGLDVLRVYLGFNNTSMKEYDRTLDIASQNDVRVIAVLTDCCCFGGSQTEGAYYNARPYCEFNNTNSIVRYKLFLERLLLRQNTINGRVYRDDPTIMAWDVANEPYLDKISDAELISWLADITAHIKSIDPNHLITFGINNGGSEYDVDGPHYSALNVPDLDFFSIHYNLPNFYNASQYLERIQFRVQNYLAMGKPVILEEFGVGTLRLWGTNLDPATMEKWLNAYRNQLDATFSAGASGALFWGWGVPQTASVPLWWQKEDHDITETAFCDMLENYQIPDPGSFHISQLPTAIPNDAFEAAGLDVSKWQGSVNGTGDIRQRDGRIFLKVGAEPASANTAVTSTWQLSGDFDIQIDFEIGEGWSNPQNDHLDGAALGVNIAGHTYHITRLRTVADDLLFAWDGAGYSLATLPSSALIGSYRLVREGSSLNLDFDIGNGWQTLASVEVADSPAQVYFTNGSINASQSFSTYFDNFMVNFGSTNYLP